MAHRRRRRRHVDPLAAGIARHLDDLPRGGAAHDRVVYQQDVLAAELEFDGVELLAHRFPPLLLAGHDERAPDVAVLDKALAVLHAQAIGHLQRGRAARIGDGDDHVDIVVGPFAQNLVRQVLAHAQARLVDRNIVDDGVGPREVDEFEQAGRLYAALRTHPAVHCAVLLDVEGLARAQVAHEFEIQCVQRGALRGDHVLGAHDALAPAQHDWADAPGVAERQDAAPGDQRRHRVAAARLGMDRGDGVEDLFRVQMRARYALLELVREDVEQDFRIRRGIEVAQVRLEQLVLEFLGVGEIAVVGHGNPVGRVHVERLRLGGGLGPRRGIATMPDAHVALQAHHVTGVEHIPNETHRLAHVELAGLARHDPRGILTAMLQHGQPIIEGLIHRAVAHHADDSAHRLSP